MNQREPTSRPGQELWKTAAQVLAVALLYWLAAVWGVKLAVASSNISPVWPATGIAIAAVFQLGYRVAPGVWLGGLAVEVYTGAPWVVCLGAPVANILEPLIAVALLRHFSGDAGLFRSARSVMEYFASAGVIAMAVF